jgi:hypothetical protein
VSYPQESVVVAKSRTPWGVATLQWEGYEDLDGIVHESYLSLESAGEIVCEGWGTFGYDPFNIDEARPIRLTDSSIVFSNPDGAAKILRGGRIGSQIVRAQIFAEHSPEPIDIRWSADFRAFVIVCYMEGSCELRVVSSGGTVHVVDVAGDLR